MGDTAARSRENGWLDARDLARLTKRIEAAGRRADARGEPVLVSLTVRGNRFSDPTAVVCASRTPGEPWWCWEQPDRDGYALGALGCAQAIEAAGPDRFVSVAARWRTLVAGAEADSSDGPPGSGLAAFGGFAFAPDGGASPRWNGYAAASMIVPELSLARAAGQTWLTINALVTANAVADEVIGRLVGRLGALRDPGLPLLDPAPVGSYEVGSPMLPAHFEAAVARATDWIRAGRFEKIVLAREVDVHAPIVHDPAAVIGLLRAAFPSCFVFAVGRGKSAFIAASPELLVRREGQRVSTVALAGSARRSSDPSVDAHLGEQLLQSEKDREENEIVVRRITRALRPHSVWVASCEPGLARIANIQHLATPIRAQLAARTDVISLVELLHPTPAVGGEPSAAAVPLIPALEGFDRGWYAGPVGWTDASGDGEFCVALRCALLRGPDARCYAGCGIVRGSDPAQELAESEVKLQVMLPVLAG